MRRILIALAAAVAVLAFASTARASAWDFSQNWDSGYSDNQVIPGTGDPWSGSNSSSYSGPHADTYYRNSSPYSVHLGTYSYGSYSYYDWYLTYKFASATPGPGTLTFWCYLRYSTLDVAYSSDGSSWTTITLYSSRTYVYGANKTVTIPAGARYIRWHANSYALYYYGCWIDDIVFKMPEHWVGGISGYDPDGLNSGTLNLTASAATIYNDPPDAVQWQYKKSTDTAWTDLPTDDDPSDGFTASVNVSSFTDYGFSVRARSVYNNTYSDWYTVMMKVQNMTVTMNPPNPDGGAMNLAFHCNIISGAGWFPYNEWEPRNTTGYYTSSAMELVNIAAPLPSGGTITKFSAYFPWIYSTSYTYKARLYRRIGTTGTNFTVVAETNSISYYQGLKTYDISGTGWSNVSKGLYYGGYFNAYGAVYHYSGPRCVGNPNRCYYKYSYSSWWYGPDTNHVAPLRFLFNPIDPFYPEDVVVQYRVGASGVPVRLPSADVDLNDADVSALWNSWAVDSDEVYFEIRFKFLGKWSDWYSFGPFTVHNRTNVTFDMAGSPSAGTFSPAADTYLLIDGNQIPPPYSETVTYYRTYEVEAPRIVYDRDGVEWLFDYWSDGGARAHEVQVVPGMNTAITAFYSTQVYFEVVSDRSDFNAPPAGYYEPGTDIQVQVSPYSYVDQTTRYRYTGYSIPALGLSGADTWFSFTLDRRTVVTLSWQKEYYFRVLNDKGVGSGTADGWYDEGTALSYTVPQTITQAALSRLDCRGFNVNGSLAGTTTEFSGTLDEPITVEWIWQMQHYVTVSTNFGTASPPDGWFDEGATVTIDSEVPPSSDVQRLVFLGWTGEGPGSVTTQGGDPRQDITVLGPITERGEWQIQYLLTLVAVNGSFSPDVSGFYGIGSEVEITIAPPEAAPGSRYIPQWTGEGEGSFSAPKDPDTPTTVTVTMNGPITETVEWFLQHLLTIENPEGYGTLQPPVGGYWYDDGAFVSGLCQFLSGTKVCAGYTATGSLASSGEPYFNFTIHAGTTVTWLWRDRNPAPAERWNDPAVVRAIGQGVFAAGALPGGARVIVWFDPATSSIMGAVEGASGWNSSTISTGANADAITIAVTPASTVLVAWHDPVSKGLRMTLWNPLAGKADRAVSSMLLPLPGDTGYNPHVAVNEAADVFVSFYDLTDTALKVAILRNDAADWTVETVSTGGNAGFHNAIAVLRHTGEPCVVFYNFNTHALHFACRGDSGWTVETVDDEGNQGFYPSLAFTPDGTPFIAYQDITDANHYHLKFATRAAGSWYTVVVDNEDGTGYYTSIAVDEEGYPHIAYHNRTTARYARYDGAVWHLTDLGGDETKDSTFIFLGSDGFPYVFFNDGGDVVLRSAKAASGGTGTGGRTGTGGGTGGETTTSGGGGGCFIATAAFGSLSAGSVRTLTDFRDRTAFSSDCGRSLVALYYALSPAPASRLDDSLKALVRHLLP